MSALRLDDCEHCACVTYLSGCSREQAVEALAQGEIGCWNCKDQDEGDGHTACVVLYDEEVMLADGRCRPHTVPT